MPDKSPGRIYSYLDGARKDTAPPGLAYAPTFGRNIDLDHFAYKEPPGGKTVNQDNILQKLYPLKWGFFRAVAKSVSEGNPVPASDTELKKVIATQMKPPFTWVYVSLKSGLHICYPYHSDYDPAYDPRERRGTGRRYRRSSIRRSGERLISTASKIRNSSSPVPRQSSEKTADSSESPGRTSH